MRRPAALLALLVLAGCGADRTPPPDVDRPSRSFGPEPASFPRAGLAFATPRGWQREDGTGPLVTRLTSGRATVAVWRFPRAEPLPEGRDALRAARDALLGAVRARDPSFRALRAELTTLDGRPAIDLRGSGRIAGRPRALRSVHAFAFGAEVVVDAFAPAADQRRVELDVLLPLLRSAELVQP